MNLDRVEPGRSAPDEINVIIEIPMNADPVKYEVDKETGALFVDRFLSTAMRYPCNYGYIPHTLCGDGDPVDVLVVSPYPLIPGVVVRARPVGMLRMSDEAGQDTKLIAVPIDRLTELYAQVREPEDLPQPTIAQIAHFFEHYKDLEPGKWVRVEGWSGSAEARAEIAAALRAYRRAIDKPAF